MQGLESGQQTACNVAPRFPSRLLVIEDSVSDQRLIKEMLIDAGARRDQVTCVDSLATARQLLTESTVDCVLIDLSLPDAVGLEGVAVMASALPDTPIVVVTGQSADSVVYAAMAEGADEFLCKAELDVARLRDTLVRAGQRRRGGARHRWRGSLGSSELESIESPIVTLDGSGRIVTINQAWVAAAEIGGGDLSSTGVGVNYLTVCDHAVGAFAEEAPAASAGIRAVLSGARDSFSMDYPCPTPDAERWFSLRVVPKGELGGGAVVTHFNITELKLAEQQLQQQDAKFRRAFDDSSPIFVLVNADWTVRHTSETATRLFGLQSGELIGVVLAERIDPADREKAVKSFRRAFDCPGTDERIVIRARDSLGRWRILDLVVANFLDDQSIGAVAVSGADVTEARRRQITHRLESRLLRSLPAAVIVTDEREVVVYWNDRAAAVYGIPSVEAVGRPIADLNVGPTVAEDARAVTDGIGRWGRWEGDYEARRSDGSLVPIHATIERVEDDEIDFTGTVATSIDITERRKLEKSLVFQALHDPLTGLPNRRKFVDYLEAALLRDVPVSERVAVLVVDLDDFKSVNDRYGHEGGDQVLQAVGTLLLGLLRDGDLVARLGGDEFVVCCDKVAGPDEALAVGRRILQVLSQPIRMGGETIAMSASVGVALSVPGSGNEELIRKADSAMYQAKEGGKARVEVFDDAFHLYVRERRALASDLNHALERGEIVTYFQPEMNLVTRRLIGFEALVRWPHAERGFVPPDQFIPVAEESGLIHRLGAIVLADACRAVAAWTAEDPDRILSVAVNASVHQLGVPEFVDSVSAAVSEAGIRPEQLCVEMTESALADEAQASTVLAALKAVGVNIAIDDFGTGYSSLSRLNRFPLDFLKIDRTFVGSMTDQTDSAMIVSAVLSLAGSLGLRTIAEGIERETQAEQLSKMGCHLGQGYLWSPAVDADAAMRIVTSARPLRAPDTT